MSDSKLQQVQRELDDVAKQVIKVQANSAAVEAAIAGKGTYRGYSGEDVFLKNNLWAVQKEMLKQLKRKERKLAKQKVQLLQHISPQPPPPTGEKKRWLDCCLVSSASGLDCKQRGSSTKVRTLALASDLAAAPAVTREVHGETAWYPRDRTARVISSPSQRSCDGSPLRTPAVAGLF